VDLEEAVRRIQDIKGIGPFAAELVVIRGANAPDALPRREPRLEAEIVERYGSTGVLTEISEAWKPFRSGQSYTFGPSVSGERMRSAESQLATPAKSNTKTRVQRPRADSGAQIPLALAKYVELGEPVRPIAT
jgi:hypothetical protein